MARRAARKGRKRRKRSGGARKKGDPTRKSRVKGHTRSPRGPNAGKKAVYVRSYSRRKPRR
jgi:hypothetical protein